MSEKRFWEAQRNIFKELDLKAPDEGALFCDCYTTAELAVDKIKKMKAVIDAAKSLIDADPNVKPLDWRYKLSLLAKAIAELEGK